MRDRLIDILSKPIHPKEGVNLAEVVADYLLDNGVIVPPCKVGDTVYVIAEKHPCYACYFADDFCHKNCSIKDKTKLVVKEATVRAIYICEGAKEIHVEFERRKWLIGYMSTCGFDDYGKIIFHAKEEAEKALAERSAE